MPACVHACDAARGQRKVPGLYIHVILIYVGLDM